MIRKTIYFKYAGRRFSEPINIAVRLTFFQQPAEFNIKILSLIRMHQTK